MFRFVHVVFLQAGGLPFWFFLVRGSENVGELRLSQFTGVGCWEVLCRGVLCLFCGWVWYTFRIFTGMIVHCEYFA